MVPAALGRLPSFCTASYHLGRIGTDFMDLAKPIEIKDHCYPNALATFMEYLMDYAAPKNLETGEALIEQVLQTMNEKQKKTSRKILEQVRTDKRDVFC
ncbi:MAG: hypothetical protein JW902_01630 [Syntrophaceae bacterium]|nr:hypothetical protein [Syntrophaceae bacterium]